MTGVNLPFVWSRILDRFQAASPTELYAIGTRLVVAAASFASGIAAIALFDPARIGVFLSFTGLAAFSTLADLGMSYSLLLATASREGEAARKLARSALTAGLPTVAVTGVLLFVAGRLFLEGGADHTFWPWLAYCGAASLQQFMMLVVTYAEGTGDRHAAWRANFILEVTAGAVFLGLVAARLELWAFAAASVVRVCLIAILFTRRVRKLYADRSVLGGWWTAWRNDLWPMQWRTFVNNALGLGTTRLLTPILLITEGAISAGRVGLVLALGAVIISATVAWPLSQTALYAALYESGDLESFTALLKRTFVRSTLLSVAVFVAGSLAGQFLAPLSLHMAARLPEPVVIWLILAACPMAHVSSFFAITLRSQRHDPVVIPNLVLAVPMLGVIVVCSRFGATAFAGAYLATATIFAGLYGAYALAFWKRLKRTPSRADATAQVTTIPQVFNNSI